MPSAAFGSLRTGEEIPECGLKGARLEPNSRGGSLSTVALCSSLPVTISLPSFPFRGGLTGRITTPAERFAGAPSR
ncbi:MAG TPA: hypothetical protein VN792_01390, partial [Candidatus Acidoferrales bacterium]|nr:hypothetical protein [Candidatus Acidoferrales bacterium]